MTIENNSCLTRKESEKLGGEATSSGYGGGYDRIQEQTLVLLAQGPVLFLPICLAYTLCLAGQEW